MRATTETDKEVDVDAILKDLQTKVLSVVAALYQVGESQVPCWSLCVLAAVTDNWSGALTKPPRLCNVLVTCVTLYAGSELEVCHGC